MKYLDSYKQTVLQLVQKTFESEEELTKVSALVVDCFKNNGKLFTFGTGHGHLLSLEMFYRAGGFVRVVPILHEPLMLHLSASQSSLEERREGLAKMLLCDYGFTEKDILFIFSNSGRNSTTIEMALEAKAMGGKTVAFTNLNHTKSVRSRHSCGKRLFEVADIVLDNFGEIGDTCVTTDNGSKICPTSTVIGALMLQMIVALSAEAAAKQGYDIEMFCSSNIDGGDEINNEFIEKYKKEIKHL